MNRKFVGLVAILLAIGAAAYVGYRDGHEHRSEAHR